MIVQYAYNIISVNTEAKCMEVVYSADGYETTTVGTMLPYDDEPLENVIRAYAPIQQWVNSKRTYANPQVGTSGTIQIDE